MDKNYALFQSNHLQINEFNQLEETDSLVADVCPKPETVEFLKAFSRACRSRVATECAKSADLFLN